MYSDEQISLQQYSLANGFKVLVDSLRLYGEVIEPKELTEGFKYVNEIVKNSNFGFYIFTNESNEVFNVEL